MRVLTVPYACRHKSRWFHIDTSHKSILLSEIVEPVLLHDYGVGPAPTVADAPAVFLRAVAERTFDVRKMRATVFTLIS